MEKKLKMEAVHLHDPMYPRKQCPIGKRSSNPKYYFDCYERPMNNHPTHPQEEQPVWWEKNFDSMFTLDGNWWFGATPDLKRIPEKEQVERIKDFIRETIAQERAAERKSIVDFIKETQGDHIGDAGTVIDELLEALSPKDPAALKEDSV